MSVRGQGRGVLALLPLTAASGHLTAGREIHPEHQAPFLPRSPTWLSTFGAAPSTALIPYGVFPSPPSSLLGTVWLLCAQRSTPCTAVPVLSRRNVHPAVTPSSQK